MTLLTDIRYAFRLMRRSPGFTSVALLALALGIGANTAIFSAVDAILLRPLPFKDPEHLVMVWEDASAVSFPRNNFSPANWLDVQRRNQVFTDFVATYTSRANLTSDAEPELVAGMGVTANFFDVLGVQPAHGRAFTADEDRGRAPVVVISHGLWARRYSADPHIVGRPILMDGEKVVVVGVMPRGFSFFRREFEFWKPAGFKPETLAQRGSHYLICFARLKPGVTLAQARSQINDVFSQLRKEYRNVGGTAGVLVPMAEQVIGDTRTALIVLLCAAGSVLLLACANLASLLIARAIGRTREVALRTALGAGRGTLLRQMVTESLLITGIGGLLGLVVAYWSRLILEQAIPEGVAFQNLQLDWRAAGFAAGLSLLTGVVFGLLPALWTLYVPVNTALKQGSRASTSAGSKLLGNALIVGEVAASLVLLVGAALMVQTLAKLYSIDLGFRSGNLLTLMTVPSPAKYSDGAARSAFYERVIDKVDAIPGVRGSAYANTLPFTSRGNTVGYRVPGHDVTDDVLFRVVTSKYLPVLGAKLRYGRNFNDSDRADSTPVVIINTTMAQRFWPGRDPVGSRIQVAPGGPSDIWHTVIGVVEDIRERGFDVEMKIGVYVLASQEARRMTPIYLAIRTDVDPASVVAAVRKAVWSVDAEQPVYRVRTMNEIVDAQVANRSLQRTLLTIFAALALFIACVGLYGVLSYRVSNRTREIGVRMALGATTSTIGRMVLRQGVALTAIGLASGIAIAIAVTRLLSTQLYGVAATDPATYMGVCAVLALVALLACYLPARRAARVDPMVALRDE
jgi:predicted permease